MEDRFTAGLVGGVLGALAMNILDIISSFLGIVEFLYLEWATLVIMGRLPAGVGEVAFGLASQIGFAGIGGAMFALLVPVIGDKNLYLKGVAWSYTIWFGVHAVATILGIPHLETISLAQALSDSVTVIPYGLALAWWLKKTEVYD